MRIKKCNGRKWSWIGVWEYERGMARHGLSKWLHRISTLFNRQANKPKDLQQGEALNTRGTANAEGATQHRPTPAPIQLLPLCLQLRLFDIISKIYIMRYYPEY